MSNLVAAEEIVVKVVSNVLETAEAMLKIDRGECGISAGSLPLLPPHLLPAALQLREDCQLK